MSASVIVVEHVQSQSVHPVRPGRCVQLCTAQSGRTRRLKGYSYLILDIFITAQFCRRRGGSLIGWRLRTQGEAGQPAEGFASCCHDWRLVPRTEYNDGDGVESALVCKPPFVISYKAWWPHGQDARRTPKDERTKRASSLHAVGPCRGAAREVSMTSRVAGRKEVRAQEASCHVPTMTTFLWSWELRCWGPCLHGILRQPMGRADVHRARLIGQRGAYTYFERGRKREGRDGKGCMEQQEWCALTPPPLGRSSHDAQVRHFGTYSRSWGTLIQVRPHMGTQNKTAACGRLRAGPVSEGEGHESTSLSRVLRQEGLAPQMCVGRVNCDARGTQRGPHPSGAKEGIPRSFYWTVIANCHARGCKCGSVGHCCGAAEASRVLG